jgi:manganese efflux pump family protein
MDILIIVIIGIGLAIDCFAVSLARGAQPGIDKIRLALVFAFVFGLFQAGMTVIDRVAGSSTLLLPMIIGVPSLFCQ